MGQAKQRGSFAQRQKQIRMQANANIATLVGLAASLQTDAYKQGVNHD